jgi:hypothetical protein
MKIKNREYTTGQDRNEQDKVVSHLYRGTFNNVGNPMCQRGWNRANGFGYSIFRNQPFVEICKICLRRAEKKLNPVKAKERKTKWF